MRVLDLIRRTPAPAPGASVPSPEPAGSGAAATADLGEAIRSIARQASSIGRGAAEVRGLIDDTTRNSTRSAEAVAALGTQVGDVHRAQQAIGAVSADALGAVDHVREALGHVAGEVGGVVTTLREVAAAAETITQIALQTRLVAFNASVEAKRAGEAGRGFGVVADAVKDLASKVEDSSKEIMRTVGMLDRRIEALAAELRIDGGGPEASDPSGAPRPAMSVAVVATESKRRFQQALAEVEAAVGRTREAARESAAICTGLDAQMAEIGVGIGGTARTLGAAMRQSETFLDVSESLIELVARCGIETDDTPFIHAAIEAAGRIGALLEEAVAGRVLSVADLFDADYRPIPGTDPAQFTTRFVQAADRLFPAVQEAVLQSSPKIVFCIAVDRNGYVPTHNRAYCHPQRGDPVWDTANSRYRRVFDDRTGLASARNERPFLLQTYRRDMGGGQHVVMKEASAPITVSGRHWGGLRLAFRF